jgi:hypothetical protein
MRLLRKTFCCDFDHAGQIGEGASIFGPRRVAPRDVNDFLEQRPSLSQVRQRFRIVGFQLRDEAQRSRETLLAFPGALRVGAGKIRQALGIGLSRYAQSLLKLALTFPVTLFGRL